MSKCKLIAAVVASSSLALYASEESPDMEFLEWLGQVAEVEALGVDVDNIMDTQEESKETEQEQSE